MTKREHVFRLLRRLRPWLINASLALGSFGVAIVLAEVAVRVVAPQQLILIRPDLWQPADTVGWLHRPNVRTEINMGERTVSVFTDAEGFRVGAHGPVSGDLQVLLLGDSFMEALQVEYEQSVAGLLETALAARAGSPVAVRNAGIGGWDTDHYALRARSLLARDDYDLVITALVLQNDVRPARRTYFPPRAPVERHRLRAPTRASWEEITDAILRPVNDFLEVRSHLFLFFRNRLQTLRMQVGLAPLDFPRHFMRSEADSDSWDVTADLCAEIADLAAQHGADALFVLLPASFQVDSTSFMRFIQGFDIDPSAVDLDQPNRRLGEALSARGLRVFDPLPQMRAAHEDGEQLFGRVDPHLSPAGNQLVARLVSPVAATLLLEDRDDLPAPGSHEARE